MKKTAFFPLTMCLTALILCGCTTHSPKQVDDTQASETPVTEESESATTDGDTLEDTLALLVKDEYPDLSITATVLERMAILPGASVPLTITITNNGEETLVYTQGSGSFETPQALYLDIPELQPILPRDYLGIATMDMQNKELLPGETLEYKLYVRAIEPNENFDDYSYSSYKDDDEYIGDIDWDTLSSTYSDLVAAKPGSYTGKVYFLYYISNQESVMFNATGYAESEFTFTITE